MVNASEFREGGRAGTRRKDNMLEFQDDERVFDEVEAPGVPEEYDKGNGARMAELQAFGDEAEAAEIEAYGRILEFPTARRPASYRRQ
ncbi:hypothetical protein L873DRAFT_1823351 [Choiromyces venosus 120613-1]|uniref:Uncharacterized protein n=1 Tax=Choiromyces venosus 120613-1 TaxID=1336337 RepID=A0A3N4IYC3_9PEZI|nr:hypothetical protein L873DRAFT_1823351 [Choiromyces venosus 120613-1]